MKEKILDILEKHYHGRNFIESRCAATAIAVIYCCGAFLIMKHLFNFLESFIEKIFIIIAFTILTPVGWIGMLIIAAIMGWIE